MSRVSCLVHMLTRAWSATVLLLWWYCATPRVEGELVVTEAPTVTDAPTEPPTAVGTLRFFGGSVQFAEATCVAHGRHLAIVYSDGDALLAFVQSISDDPRVWIGATDLDSEVRAPFRMVFVLCLCCTLCSYCASRNHIL